MHDRRVDGEALSFGNQGALYMNAMTWWDHGTESVWSQPWGTAIAGPLRETALTLIPASIVPWSTWLAEHPQTTVLGNSLTPTVFPNVIGRDDFVIGVALGDSATAYPYPVASDEGVVNDLIGDHPVVVLVDAETRDIKVFLRRPASSSAEPAPDELRFELDDQGRLVDQETGSLWDRARGVAIEGPLKGAALQQIPYVSSFDWAWVDFFPHTNVYRAD